MKLKHLMLPVIAVFLGTTFGFRVTARELEEPEKEVEAQIQAVIRAQSNEGYELAFPRTVSKLARGAQAPKTVRLYPKGEYSFVAVCDQRCDDVDLIIKDGDGNQVAADVAEYAIAVVNYRPPTEGSYQVNVKMNECSKDNCHFGLGVFLKSEG